MRLELVISAENANASIEGQKSNRKIIYFICFVWIAGIRLNDHELEEVLDNGLMGTHSFSVR